MPLGGICSYCLPARYYVRVDERPDGNCEIGLSASTVKGYDIFATQFNALLAEFTPAMETAT